jgi:O-antigen ligase
LFFAYNIIAFYSLFDYLNDSLSNGLFLKNPNHLATFISVPLPLIFYLYFVKKDNGNNDISLKIIKMMHIFVLFFILYLTNGRTAILSSFMLLLIYMFFERKRIKLKFILFYLILSITVVILVFINKGIINSKVIITEQLTNSLSLELRLEIIKNSLNILKDNIIFGIGAGQFPIVYPYYSTGHELIFIHHAHNDYIQFLVEYGLLGFLIILYFYYKLITFMKYGLNKLKDDSYHLFLATIFSILIFHFQIITSFQTHIGILFYTLIFLVISLYLIVYNFDRHFKSNNNELL